MCGRQTDNGKAVHQGSLEGEDVHFDLNRDCVCSLGFPQNEMFKFRLGG